MRSSLLLATMTSLFAACQPGGSSTQVIERPTQSNTVAGEVSLPPDTADIGGDSDLAPSDAPRTDASDSDPVDPAETVASNSTEVSGPSVSQQAAGEVEIITFDDLNIGMPADAKFRPVLLEYNDGRVKDLLGKRVNVAGYMNAADTLQGVKEFILLRNVQCKFGPGGQADHLVHVLLQGEVETEFTDQIVYVEGVLELKEFPEDGPSTWSIYDLKATKVSTKPPPRRR